MGVRVEEQWRYRKVKSERASKSTLAFKINNTLKKKSSAQMAYGYGNIAPYSKEVIVKITGGARHKKGIKNTIEYISKNWQEELIDNYGIKYSTKEEMQSAVSIVQENVVKSIKSQSIEGKLTQNMVFSAPKGSFAKKEHVLEATVEALKEKYPDNYFVAAYHDETKNPHVHIVLNINKDNGNRINIKKADLRDIRKGFCKNLIEQGYDVEANRKYKDEKYNFKSTQFKESPSRESRNIYQLVDFGTESYKLDKKNDRNSYLIYKTANEKEVTIWGKELLDEVVSKGLKKGDSIKVKKMGHVNVKVPVYGNGAEIIAWKETKRNQWKVEKAENNITFSESEYVTEIKLDNPEQAAKQLQQRERFNHEKKLLLDPSYKENVKLKLALQHKQQKQSIRF